MRINRKDLFTGMTFYYEFSKKNIHVVICLSFFFSSINIDRELCTYNY